VKLLTDPKKSGVQMSLTSSTTIVSLMRLDAVHTIKHHCTRLALASYHKNSSGDEIANVNFYAVYIRPGSYPNSLK